MSSYPAANVSFHWVNPTYLDYVLVFLGDGSPKDEENLYLDNPVAEHMVEKWIAEGGILGGFNLNITDPTRKSNG